MDFLEKGERLLIGRGGGMGGRQWERLVVASLGEASRLDECKVTRILGWLQALSGEGRALLERDEGIPWASFNFESWFLKLLDLRPRGWVVRGSLSQSMESPPSGKTGHLHPLSTPVRDQEYKLHLHTRALSFGTAVPGTLGALGLRSQRNHSPAQGCCPQPKAVL